MTYQFRPAKRENVGLLIGLSGSSGSGKTFSALRLAMGLAGGKPIAVIDTEARRALHYADAFRFDHCELRAPFRPDAYAEAIKAADDAHYPVIVVDSASHEWAGEGGILDWQEDELDRMAGDDWKKRESCKMAAWIKPKMSHKAMIQKLLQVRAHLILCFRAEPKIEMVRKDGHWVIEPKQSPIGLDGWIPICEKNMPYELTASFLLIADRPGVPHAIKLQEQHRLYFPDGQPITEKSGEALAAWALGGDAPRPVKQAPQPQPAPQQQARPQQAQQQGPTVVPFGKNKGKPLSELTDASLTWYIENGRRSVEDPTKARYKAGNEAFLAALLSEQGRRSNTDPPAEDYDYGPPPMSDEELAK